MDKNQNIVIIDADFATGERLEAFVLKSLKELMIQDKIYNTRVFCHHEDAYDYLAVHQENVGAYFAKISTRLELEAMKRLQKLQTNTFFMVYSDNQALNSALLSLTVSKLWMHMTAQSDQDGEMMEVIQKVLKYAFVNRSNVVEVDGVPIVVDSLLYVESDKSRRNYLRAVTKDNECLVRATITEIKSKIPVLFPFNRGLLVNKDKIRRIEKDGITACFEGTLIRVKAAPAYKAELAKLKTDLEWIK